MKIRRIVWWLLVGLIGIIAALFILVIIWSAIDQKQKISVPEMQATIAQEVEASSTPAQVATFFDRHGFTRSDYMPEFHAMYGSLVSPPHSFLIERDLYVTFHFDNRDRLASSTVEEQFTGF